MLNLRRTHVFTNGEWTTLDNNKNNNNIIIIIIIIIIIGRGRRGM
jgi:hypothetical protein